MKLLITSLLVWASALGALGQGTVMLLNRVGSSVDAPVYDTDGTTKLAGTGFRAQLYAGTTEASLAAVGDSVTFRTGVAAGYFDSGSDSTRTIPGVAAGGKAYVQVRAWDATKGSTYETAQSAGGKTGSSDVFSVTTGGGLIPPAQLLGLRTFKLQLSSKPVITKQPVSLALGAGDTARFEVTATGTDPISYQWFKGTSPISGATTRILELKNITSANAASYFVRVTNSKGSVDSNPATLTIVPLPVIASFNVQPNPPTVGQSLRIDAVVQGTGPFTYQWLFNTSPIAGATTAILQRSSAEAGTYALRVTGPGGTTTRDAVTVTSLFVLSRSADPGGTLAISPDRATYTSGTVVTLTATAEPGYEFAGWSGDLSGTQNPATLTMNSSKSVLALFRAVGGTIYFSNRNLGIGLDAPIFDTDGVTKLSGDGYVAQLWAGPTTETLAAVGAPIAFRTGDGVGYFFSEIRSVPTVTAGQTAQVQVRAWQRSAGETYPAAVAANGKHGSSVTLAIVTGNAGSPPSLPAYLVGLRSFQLQLSSKPSITKQPVSLALGAGDTARFEVTATGSEPLQYQWFKGTSPLASATTRVLELKNITSADAASYFVRVTNGKGSVDSTPATLTLVPLPVIASFTVKPSPPTVGQALRIEAVVQGTGPFTYQWLFNTSPISGATAAILERTSAEAGVYALRVTGPGGTITRDAVTVTALFVLERTADPGGTITVNPDRATYTAGTVVTLSATAEPGFVFAGWSGDLSGTQNPATITMNSSKSVQALFRAVGGTVYFSNRNLGVGIDAPIFDTDGVTKLSGDGFVAQLWAGPNADSLAPIGAPMPFRTGDGVGYFYSETRSIPNVSPGAVAYTQVRAWQRSAGETYEAAVANKGKYGLSKVLANPTGNAGSPPSLPTYLLGLVSFKLGTAPVEFTLERVVDQGGKITANPDRATYAAGAVVTLTATADSGFIFSGWSGDVTGTQNPTTITLNSNRRVEATFLATGGTVFFSNRNLGVGLDAPVFDTDGVTRLAGGAFVAQLWAGPNPDALAPIGPPVEFRSGDGAGYFAGEIRSIPTVSPGHIAHAQVRAWERSAGETFEAAVAANGKHGYSSIVANATGNVGSPPSLPTYLLGLASFKLSAAPAQFALARVVADGGRIDATPDQERYLVDTVVKVQAVPQAGYEFVGWLGDLTGTENPQNLTMNREKRVEALFRATGGTVYFVNRNLGAGVDAPIFDTDGITRLSGDGYLAQLYAGPTADTLAPIGDPSVFRTGDGAGYFFAATRSIPTVVPGQVAQTQVRVWKRSDGDTFEAAASINAKRGVSAILAIQTGNAGKPPSLPAYLKGLTSFKLSVDSLPTVTLLSPVVPIPAGQRAQLLVSGTGSKPLKYQWYEGNPGDTSKPVGTDSPAFESEPLWASTTFWVRVSNPLGKADTGAISVTVTRLPQTLTFNALPPIPYGIETLTLSATASSGLPVSFSVESGPGTVLDHHLTITGAGTIVIRATQAGNAIYLPASPVTQSLVVKKATALISLTRLHQVFDGQPKSPDVRVTPSGLEVQLTYNGSSTAPTAAGTYAVVATVVDENYAGSARAEFEIKAGVNLGGFVFSDEDGDGLKGGTEAGIADVVVRVLSLDGTTQVRTEKTDATGAFAVKSLPAGSYYVGAENPTGYVSTTPELALVNVSADTVTTVLFGKQAAGTVSGLVFEDLDGDGQRDDGEKGLEGVTLKLASSGAPRTTQTLADGSYRFTNVSPGSYSVEETDPNGYVSTTPNTRSISLSSGGAASANFGDRPASQISGLVFLDANGNGTHDDGEPGLAEVNIRLSGPDGLQSRTTDANGQFLFEETVAGVYTLEEIDPVGYTSTTPNLRTLTLSDGESARVAFGDQAVGRVAGLVFDDRNGNGSADSGEPGIPDVSVRLSNGSGQQTVHTDTTGAYVFHDVAPGTYTLEETDLAGFLSTTPNTRTIAVASGGSASMNFGDQAVGTVSGSVFVDSDGNGTRDTGESGIGGVTIRLIGSTGQRSTTTAGDGSYRFTAVVAGSYQVEETDPLGYVSTTSNSRAVSVANGGSANADFGDLAVGSVTGTVFEDLNGDGSRDAGEPGLGGVTLVLVGKTTQRSTTTSGDGTYQFNSVEPGTYAVEETDPIGFSSTTPNLRTINVASGGAAAANFGDQAAGTVGGIVFDDLNGNGLQETGEPGIGGVDVKLIGTGGQRNAVTSGNGSYLFAGVDPGAYTLEESDPAGFSSTTPNLRTLILTSGGAVTANFGDQAVGSIAGIVFADANGNGIREPEEAGIGGVAIKLASAAGQRSTVTSGDGTYQFSGLNPGSYTVEETDPADFVSTTPNLRAVSLASGGSASASFGDQAVKTISGIVFEDQDHDGAYDAGEPGIGGVNLQLLRANDESVVRETVTSGTGSFVFADVPAGDYIVRQTVPDAYTVATGQTTPSAAARHGVGVDSTYANKEVSLAANGAAAVNFGVSVTGQLIGVVFNDLDGDGNRSADEPGLGGITIELRHPQTGNVVESTTTSGSGVYLFVSLPVGDYQVVQKPLTGYLTAQPSRLVTLASGGAAGANFANQAVGTISGRVFNDEDGDGELDDTEPGMGGVQVTLTASSGPVRQITTSGDGTFLFTGVVAGTVNLTQSVPSGFTATTPSTVTLAVSSETAASASFGNQSDNLKPPTITSEPTDHNVVEGASLTLTVVAEGTAPIQYQWLKEGTPIPNATNASLVLDPVRAADAAGYQVRVQNPVATLVSRVARVTVSSGDAYTSWATTQDLPAGASGPEDDPDGDGLPNLLEFALGSSPKAASEDGLPVLILTALGADQWLGFEIQRPRAAANVRLVLQASDDLKTWSTIAANVTVVQTGASADLVRVMDATPVANHPYRFLRLGAASPSEEASPATLTLIEDSPIATGARLSLTGTPGKTYLVEWSTDLITWHTLQEVVATDSPLVVVDNDADNSTYRFYRANAR